MTHITLHDLRRYHNTKLRDGGFSNNESGSLIGNSERVNSQHYDPKRDERLLRSVLEKRKALGRIAPSLPQVS